MSLIAALLLMIACGGGSSPVASVAPPPPPPPPPGSTGGGTAISACGQTLQANSSYYLTTDIGTDPGTVCLTPAGPNMELDLKGYKVTGKIKSSAIDLNGIHVHNGSIVCSDSDGSKPGCLYLSMGSGALTTALELDHLDLKNTASTNSNSERNLMVDVGSLSKSSSTAVNIKVHDNTSISATGLSSSRIVNLQVQGTAHSNGAYAEFYNNTVTCQSTAAACQGIVAYGLWNVKVHDNTMTNQLSNPASTETSRAIICDQTDGCEIYGNVIDAQDGRAVRLRGTSNKNDVNAVHDNVINNVVLGGNPNQVAAFHLGDPDSGTEVENATIYNNTFNAKGGWIFMARAATAISIHDNTVNDSASINLLDSRYAGTTQVDLFRTTINGGAAISSCESGTSVTVCKSGTAVGACVVNNSAC